MIGTNTDFWITIKNMKIDEESRRKIEKTFKNYNQQSLEYSRIYALIQKVEKFITKHCIEAGNIDFGKLIALSPRIKVSNY